MIKRLMRALAAVVLLLATAPPARADGELDVRSADGTALRALAVGDRAARTVVIVLHGGPGLSLDHLLPLRRLADGGGRRLVFYEQRGAGESSPPASGDYSLAAHVADLDAVRLAAGGGVVHLLAHSWGTVIALAYAVAHPREVASLILVGMGAPSDVDDRRSFGAVFGARRARLARAGLIPRKRPPPDGDDCMASFSASLPAHFADPRHPAARRLPGTYRCGVASATLRAVAGWDFRPDLPRMVPRVLLITGDADANYAGVKDTAARLGGKGRLEVLERCGHFPWLECPEAFYGVVEGWLGGR